MATADEILALARRIDEERATEQLDDMGPAEGSLARATAILLATAYPATATSLRRDPSRAPLPTPLGSAELGQLAEELAAIDPPDLPKALRQVASRERLRIALRELLPTELGGAEVVETARALADLAELTIQVALAQAQQSVAQRLGTPRGPDGAPSKLVVFGMGKLGGRELNAGSDVDLVCFYDSDEHEIVQQDGTLRPDLSTHEVWTKVVQRMTAILEQPTADGIVWRVDLRLRPEGARGALVNSVAAAEHYYETFGRLWERATWLRARPVAGDFALGNAVLAALTPFVWRRHVDPTIARTMYELVHRAREELSAAPERDLKFGPGGIREAEFFVQALQLVWGGRDPRLRVAPTLEAMTRLRAAGLVTELEADELSSAYVMLRRAEHAVQVSTGLQTHDLPRDDKAMERLARVLGYPNRRAFVGDLERHTARVSALLVAILPGEPGPSRWDTALKALDHSNLEAFGQALQEAGLTAAAEQDGQLARDLFETARKPDGPLGVRTREQSRDLASTLLDALSDTADPRQAARYLRGFVARLPHPSVYTKLLSADPAAVRRLITVLGGSAFVGEVVAARPELADLVLFEPELVDCEAARVEVARALKQAQQLTERDPQQFVEEQVGLLRQAKVRITTRIALADLAEQLDTPAATSVLSTLADSMLEAAARLALGTKQVRGLAVIAMGKLGGCEIGYGSDLDVIFLYDPAAAPTDDPLAYYGKRARRIIQLITMPHYLGVGYELDTRLRPSGNQGLLVVSLGAFARYHEVSIARDEPLELPGERAATWERLALLRARFAAGDAEIGAQAIAVAHRAAYGRGARLTELAAHVHRLRKRMQEELAKERPGRYDLKFGRGGLVEIELAVQLLQLANGADERVRRTEIGVAIDALAELGVLSPGQGRAFREGYTFLRRLEQRLRVVHGDSTHLLEQDAAGLLPLARRMGIAGADPAAQLMAQYRHVTAQVRRSYEQIVDAPT